MASLRLEPRPWEEDTDKGKAVGGSSLKFRVLLSKEQMNEDLGISWKWQHIEVEPVETFEDPVTGRPNESPTLSIATLSIVQSYVSSYSIPQVSCNSSMS